MGTRKNPLTEAVLTCTHNLCFEQKLEKYQKLSSENYHFYSCEILQYIARTCLRNGQKYEAVVKLSPRSKFDTFYALFTIYTTRSPQHVVSKQQ